MAIRLTEHARAVAAARGLDPDWIARTVQAPERSAFDPRDPSLIRAYGTVQEAGGRILRVVYRWERDDMVVVTAFFDRGARR